jgi:hypothetical protein
LTYRNYGEFVGTVSQAELDAINRNQRRSYPDLTPNVTATPTKKALEGHVCPTFRNFDMHTPDAMTTDSYLAALNSHGQTDPLITVQHPDPRSVVRRGLAPGSLSSSSAWRPGRPPDAMNCQIFRLSGCPTITPAE